MLVGTSLEKTVNANENKVVEKSKWFAATQNMSSNRRVTKKYKLGITLYNLYKSRYISWT